jgi:hypothetical protein
MKQTPFTTDKGEFLAIELPERICELKYDHHFLKGTGINECPDCGMPLNPGDWQIITPNASEATEEQAREVAEETFFQIDYETSKDFLNGTLKHLGLTGTVTVLKKVK